MSNFNNKQHHLSLFFSVLIASNLSSPNFRIDMGTINITGGGKVTNLNTTIGQTTQGRLKASSPTPGPKLEVGFQHLNLPPSFSFTIDKTSLSFNALAPDAFQTEVNTLTVKATNIHGYSVKIIEDHPPSNDKAVIQNTTCDPIAPCSLNTATAWTSSKVNGFGYSLDGTNYRPLPDNSANESPLDIINHSGFINDTKTTTITYKVSRPASQPAGIYQNTIQYIAIPSI